MTGFINRNKLKLSALILALVGTFSVVGAAPAFAAPCPQSGPLGFPTWFKHLECVDNVPQLEELNDGWLIAAAVLEIMFRIGSILAIVYITWAGFVYITSAGEPAKTAQARNQIVYAIAGLVITIVAATVVSQVMNILNPSGSIASASLTNDTVARVLRIVYAVGGAIAVVMVVIGGIRFTTSNGDPSAVKSGRDTIIYALVGIVVILLASSITTFVLGRL